MIDKHLLHNEEGVFLYQKRAIFQNESAYDKKYFFDGQAYIREHGEIETSLICLLKK